jgi:hypothetical protein
MNISRYHYPHPVLGKEEDYPDGITEAEFKINKANGQFAIEYRVEYTDRKIKALIDEGSAELICEVNCSSTFFRKCFRSEKLATSEKPASDGIDFRIKDELLRGQVEFLFLIVATRDIPDYSPDSRRGMFGDRKFWIQKGELLAFLGNQNKNIDLSGDTADQYIKITPSDTAESVDYDFTEDFIKIVIPRVYYLKIEQLKGDESFRKTLISTHISPAIQNALCHFLKGQGEGYSYSEKQWYLFLKDQVLNYTASEEASLDLEDLAPLTEEILKNQSLTVIDTLQEVFQETEENDSYE